MERVEKLIGADRKETEEGKICIAGNKLSPKLEAWLKERTPDSRLLEKIEVEAAIKVLGFGRGGWIDFGDVVRWNDGPGGYQQNTGRYSIQGPLRMAWKPVYVLDKVVHFGVGLEYKDPRQDGRDSDEGFLRGSLALMERQFAKDNEEFAKDIRLPQPIVLMPFPEWVSGSNLSSLICFQSEARQMLKGFEKRISWRPR